MIWKKRVVAFLITFIAYMTIHIVRKPSSVLKSVLHPSKGYDSVKKPGWSPFNQDVSPSRVAQVGLNVEGAFLAEQNGLYKCSHTQEKDGACLEFAHTKISMLSISKVSGSICKKFVDSTYDKEFCWVLTPTNNKNIPPFYSQLFEGNLPDPVHSGDANLDKKSWKRFDEMEKKYVSYSKLHVSPNVQDGKVLLGLVDTCFLLAYTVGLFVSGYIADRVDIRKFLTIGMISSGLSSVFLGLAHRFEVHALSYFVVVSVWGGLSQSVGWPSVVTVMGRWFPKDYRRRGLVMGAWTSNLSIGNILGSVITTWAVQWGMDGEDWPLGYEIPGYITIACSLLVFFFLEVDPKFERTEGNTTSSSIESSFLPSEDVEENNDHDETPAPSLLRALLIPGVIPFALSLCFAKMGQYALLFWGPYYLQVVGFSSEKAGYLCSFFDVGGLLGGIAAGWFSDRIGRKRGITASVFLIFAAIFLIVYYDVTKKAGDNVQTNIWMMILVGFWVNGPVSLITTAASVDLANHPSLNGDERLIGSVAGIIDGSGSFGAAIQGVAIGVISTSSWEKVFQFLVICCVLSASLLGSVVKKEIFS